MRRLRVRFFLTFLAGVVVASLAGGLTGGVRSFAATRYEDLSLFTSVLTLVRRNYVEPVDEHTLVRGAVRGMLEELDPHSSFMDADAYKEMQVDTKGEFHGLGIEITKRKDGYIEVIAPIDGTPASRAGIKARDQIVAICPTKRPEDWTEDCRGTKRMSLFDAVKLMRGRKGSKITIRVFRDSFERPKSRTSASSSCSGRVRRLPAASAIAVTSREATPRRRLPGRRRTPALAPTSRPTGGPESAATPRSSSS